jgi:hypothetical protein
VMVSLCLIIMVISLGGEVGLGSTEDTCTYEKSARGRRVSEGVARKEDGGEDIAKGNSGNRI